MRRALLGLVVLAGCSPSPSLVLHVKSARELDRLLVLVRADDAQPRKVITRHLISDLTAMHTRSVVTGGVDVAIDFPGPGRYSLALIGWQRPASCLDQLAYEPGAAPPPLEPGFESQPREQAFFAETLTVPLPVVAQEVELWRLEQPIKNDADCDGFPNWTYWPTSFAGLQDCGDGDQNDPRSLTPARARNPFVEEHCDSPVDVDCDGHLPPTCPDSDGDGDHDPTDCEPLNPRIHHATAADPFPETANCCGYLLGKGATAESGMDLSNSPLCHPDHCSDTIDYDCDGKPTPCVLDHDCDTFGASNRMAAGCSAPPSSPPGTDCNDCDPKVKPSAPEICGDGIDNNCDGQEDEVCNRCDLDADGFQAAGEPGCPEANYKLPLDCADDDAGRFPGAIRKPVPLPGLAKAGFSLVCDGAHAAGSPACALRGYCASAVNGVNDHADCPELVDSCFSQDCDRDGDGFLGKQCGGTDCNDSPAQGGEQVFPHAPEKCGDDIDQDCDGVKPDCSSFKDMDGDRYADDWDCEPGNPGVHPFAIEVCDGIDNDCDGLVDEGNPDPNGAPMGTVAAGNATECRAANSGPCLTGPPGHCICSPSAAPGTFVPGRRASCVGDASIDTDMTRGRAFPRCFHAPQPQPELCNGIDDSCTGAIHDTEPADHRVAGSVVDCPGPYDPMKGALICCPPSVGNGPPGCQDPTTNVNHCGGCGRVCSKRNGNPSCQRGVCLIACYPDWADCDNRVGTEAEMGNGCETHLSDDVANCGQCGFSCVVPNGLPGCAAGVCVVLDCNLGYRDCNAVPGDGCEVDIRSDVNNCAGCGVRCAPSNASGRCSGGNCQIQACNAGFGDCNNRAIDGCEIATAIDPANCGQCGKVCPVPRNASAGCAAGTCGIGKCLVGYLDCNNKAADGCETDIYGDRKNCGACGNVCGVGLSCQNGFCVNRPRFAAAVAYPFVNVGTQAMALGDANGDKVLDITAPSYTTFGYYGVLLGNPDGTFQAARTYTNGVGLSQGIAMADFNGDAKLDLLYTVSNGGNAVAFLAGNGDGTFRAGVTTSTGGANPIGLVVADLNGDATLDALVCNQSTPSLSVLIGKGDGTFRIPANPLATQKAPYYWPALGDFNSDGKLDIASPSNAGQGWIEVMNGNGDGTFNPSTTIALAAVPSVAKAVDLNADGWLDLAVSLSGSLVGVILNDRKGNFLPMVTYAVGLSPFAITTGDFDGDGNPDLVTTNQNSNTVSVLIGRGDGTFKAGQAFAVAQNPSSVVVSDFNGDGMDDIAVACAGSSLVSVLLAL